MGQITRVPQNVFLVLSQFKMWSYIDIKRQLKQPKILLNILLAMCSSWNNCSTNVQRGGCTFVTLIPVYWTVCSSWNNCSTNVQRGGCTFYDLFTQVVQYSYWSRFHSSYSIERYNEAIESVHHLCINIEPGTNTGHSVSIQPWLLLPINLYMLTSCLFWQLTNDDCRLHSLKLCWISCK